MTNEIMADVSEGDRFELTERKRQYKNATGTTVGVENVETYPNGKEWDETTKEWEIVEIEDRGEVTAENLFGSAGIWITVESGDGERREFMDNEIAELLEGTVYSQNELTEHEKELERL